METSNDTLIAIGNLISRGDDNVKNYDKNGYWTAKYKVLKEIEGDASSDTISIGYTYGSFPKLLPEIAKLRLLKFNDNKNIPNYYIEIDIKEYNEKSIIELKDTFIEITTIGVFDGEFINKYGMVIITPLILIMFLKTCSTNSRVDNVTKQVEMTNQKIDSLETDFEKEIQIEGLKSEKRMIQSVSRSLIDRERERQIDKEIERLNK
jgi:hypothetical protein